MLRMRTTVAGVIALAAMAVVTSASPAASPGVNIAGPPTPELVNQTIASGAKSVRIFVLWRDLEPASAGQYPPDGNSPYGLQQLSAVYDQGHQALNAAGVLPLYVLVEAPHWANGSSDPLVPPTDMSRFAAFAGRFAAHNKQLGGRALGYEIWNEPDEVNFWHPAPDAARYAEMLKKSYAAIKAADPSAVVVSAPTTGNNAGWMRKLYEQGAGGSFDAAAVHTDTACLIATPDTYYREENGDVGQFSFLGYRTVRQVMAENGDGHKPIFMSELGWSSTGGVAGSCARGKWAGQKPDGVTEADQAAYLTKAFGCMANDPYLTHALWFTLYDATHYTLGELNHYGLLRPGGQAKPAYQAFKQIAVVDGGAATECGDFEGPQINVIKPAPGEQFLDKIDISSTASDAGVGMFRVSYTFNGGQKIRNFEASAGIDFSQQLRQAPWHGAKNLPVGEHILEITATDANGNKTTRSIPVVKVASLDATLLPSFVVKKKRVRCKGAVCSIAGQLKKGAPGTPTIGGKVAVEWQFRNKKGKWRKLVGGLKPAHKPFTFKAKLSHRGKWRVRMVYLGKAPWKTTSSSFVQFSL